MHSSALLVLTYDVLDPTGLAAYREAAIPALIGPGRGELLTSTADTIHLIDASCGGNHTVVIRFDNAEHARAVYDSDDYQALIGQRLTATRPRVEMIVPVSK